MSGPCMRLGPAEPCIRRFLAATELVDVYLTLNTAPTADPDRLVLRMKLYEK